MKKPLKELIDNLNIRELKEVGRYCYSRIGSHALKTKYSKAQRSEMARCNQKKRWGHNVVWDKEKKKCIELGAAFNDNIEK